MLDLKYLKGDIAFPLKPRRADVDVRCAVGTERSVSMNDALSRKEDTVSVVNKPVSMGYWCNDTDRRNNEVNLMFIGPCIILIVE